MCRLLLYFVLIAMMTNKNSFSIKIPIHFGVHCAVYIKHKPLIPDLVVYGGETDKSTK